MISNYLGEFISLAIIHFLSVVAPGPDFAVTIRQSVRFCRSAGSVLAQVFPFMLFILYSMSAR